MEVKSSKLYSFYLGIVSFVSIIAIGINLGIVLTSIGKYYIVTDEEYLQFNQSYRLTECKNPTYTTAYDKSGNVLPQTNPKTPTDEEITKCEEKVRSEVKFSRAYDLKDMFITSGAWFIVFVLFFLFHYPKFVRQKEENTENEKQEEKKDKKEEKPEAKKTTPKKTTKK